MAITRTLTNGQKVTDWTEEVNDIDNQYGLFNGTGLFDGRGTSQTSIQFDKSTNQILLLPQSSRQAGPASKNTDRKHEMFALALPYYLHQDYISPHDIQGYRKMGSSDGEESLATVRADKMEDMRLSADQTREFMKISAIKGQTKDAYGNDIADMFATLGTTQLAVDFELTDQTTDIVSKCAQLKRMVAKNAKTGGRIGKIEVMVTPAFFDALISHAKIKEAYLHYSTNPQSDVHRGDLQRFETWGVVDTFKTNGITFYTYDAEFTKDDGNGTTSIINGIGNNTGSRDENTREGFTVIRGQKNLYKGVYGPANTLSGANSVGSEIMFTEYRDPKDKFHEMELEMAGLYYMTRPQLSVRVHDGTV